MLLELSDDDELERDAVLEDSELIELRLLELSELPDDGRIPVELELLVWKLLLEDERYCEEKDLEEEVSYLIVLDIDEPVLEEDENNSVLEEDEEDFELEVLDAELVLSSVSSQTSTSSIVTLPASKKETLMDKEFVFVGIRGA